MNNIGIAGFGKMGRDIFSLFLTNPDIPHITVLCRHDIETHTAKMQKDLARSLKRKKLTQEQFNEKSANVHFTENIADLKDCDIIIESITENLPAKRELFAELDKIAGKDCIFATNTSSLAIPDIFGECSGHERCIGLHFFYPVRLSGFAELNVLSGTGTEQVSRVMELLKMSGKKGIVFRDCYHIYLNQLINALISKGIQIRNENNMNMKQMQEILSEMFAMHGLFGMIDGIGIDLLTKNKMKNCCERLVPVIEYGSEQMKRWLDAGCSGEPDCFFDTFEDVPYREVTETEKNTILKTLYEYIRNELAVATAEYGGEPQILIDAVRDTLGLAENFEL